MRRIGVMSIYEQIQAHIQRAMKSWDNTRLNTLRLAKGAIVLKEKEKGRTEAITDQEIVGVLRSEIRQRKQGIETYDELGKTEEVHALQAEIAVLEEFLPDQLSAAEIESRIRSYLSDHPEINHAGRLTGALKKELGDAVDGSELHALCSRILAEESQTT